jgi:hypothetical protein
MQSAWRAAHEGVRISPNLDRMTPEWLNLYTSVATLLVVAIAAYAALRQIRHLREANQVSALLPLVAEYWRIQPSIEYARTSLRKDLEDPRVRDGAAQYPMVGPAAAAIPAVNYFETMGALVLVSTIELPLVLMYFQPSAVWEGAIDLIALTRRTGGPELFECFEALVALERAYNDRRGSSRYPKNVPHLDVPDRYAAADRTAPPPSL